ncbi:MULTISPECIES: hypothetical protein [unclassified Oceanispirochaeta]|uniref:hypothetical protein n=1 Tax=unclassified Oceanispirochaeta TaxID=2635722 RepID=UPI00131426C0|nr:MULTISPECIES: hypothetical protein [unclassified Oceanispirochaeta]MBF9016097.1 hypothetical protein [Oceanispirochaeta sp. M2]NPD72560.1 hypothetical protein [Oceanispirochaeta sp. M1]
MTEEESVRLYQFLSSEYAELDIPMRELLHKLEKELFSSFTISQIESIQLKTSGEN